MDFGLDKFIDMFEARFGRKVTTGLLVLIGVGIASAMIHTTVRDLVVPFYDVILNLIDAGAFKKAAALLESITKYQVIAGAIELFFLMGCTTIYYNQIRRRTIERIKKIILEDPMKFLNLVVKEVDEEAARIINSQAESPQAQAPQLPPAETSPQKSLD